jgi:glycerophosphoryl diester phosphodiesterase
VPASGVNILIDVSAHPVIAHRGNSAHAPENTLVSFDQAAALGADALEFDVRLTRDGIPVVIHDATLDRTTNGAGPVAAVKRAELQRLDAGARFTADQGRSFPYRARAHTVPTLEEMLVRYDSIPFLIEVKIAEAVEPTRRLLERYGATNRTVVDSAVHDAVAPFRATRGTLATGASMPEVIALLRRACLPLPSRDLPFQALCIPQRYHGVPIPAGRLATVARRAGVATHVWTVNDPAVARRLWRRGVQGIVTDDPGVMLKLRGALFGSASPLPDSGTPRALF